MRRWIAVAWGVTCVAFGIGWTCWVLYRVYTEGIDRVGPLAIAKNLGLCAGAIAIGVWRIRGKQ